MNRKEWLDLPIGTVVYWEGGSKTLQQYGVKIDNSNTLIVSCVIFPGDSWCDSWCDCAGELESILYSLHWYKIAPKSIQNKFKIEGRRK